MNVVLINSHKKDCNKNKVTHIVLNELCNVDDAKHYHQNVQCDMQSLPTENFELFRKQDSFTKVFFQVLYFT